MKEEKDCANEQGVLTVAPLICSFQDFDTLVKRVWGARRYKTGKGERRARSYREARDLPALPGALWQAREAFRTIALRTSSALPILLTSRILYVERTDPVAANTIEQWRKSIGIQACPPLLCVEKILRILRIKRWWVYSLSSTRSITLDRKRQRFATLTSFFHFKQRCEVPFRLLAKVRNTVRFICLFYPPPLTTINKSILFVIVYRSYRTIGIFRRNCRGSYQKRASRSDLTKIKLGGEQCLANSFDFVKTKVRVCESEFHSISL